MIDHAAFGTRIQAKLSLALLFYLVSAPASLSQQATTGDPVRGRFLFTDAYKCYACHGYDAQTGQRRLVPMNFTQEAFTILVQNSPLPQMPMYADVGDQDLADIYSYILSIPVDAPDVAEIPLLSEITERATAELD